MQICIERIRENAILMHFPAIVPDLRASGEPENITNTHYIDDFPAVWWNYGKLSSNFFLSSVKVIDTAGFLSFFQNFYSNNY